MMKLDDEKLLRAAIGVLLVMLGLALILRGC